MKTIKKCCLFKENLRVVCFICIQVQNVPPSCSHPFCWHADKMQDKCFQSACLFQWLDLFADMTDKIEIEVLQHGSNHHEHHVLSHEGKGQMCPAEVIVLYIEVLFACSTFIVKCNDVLLGRCPVIGKDTAVCVYHSEHIRLFLSVLVFQRPTLYDKPVWLSFDELVHADGGNIAFLITNFNALPFFQLAELLVAAAAVDSTYIERVAALLYGLDDFLFENDPQSARKRSIPTPSSEVTRSIMRRSVSS